MGTRSLIYFEEKDGTVYVVIYQQYDGGPSCVGLTLAEFLSNTKIINGYTTKDEKKGNVVNGFDDLVATFIAKNKNCIGKFYIYPSTTQPGTCGDEWNYHVVWNDEEIRVNVLEVCSGNSWNDMNVEQFLSFCN